jgi:polysaccharide pyruvyl transferase WcaK-like protein
MRILLSAFIGSSNLGDEAIFSVLSEMIDKQLGADLTVLTMDKEVTRRHSLPSSTVIVQSGFRNFVRSLRESDALVIGGGGIIQDESSVLTIAFYYLQSFVAKHFFHRPVYLAFVGVGPVTSRLGNAVLRWFAKVVELSLVRDTESVQMLVDHGFSRERIILAVDIVYGLPDPKCNPGTQESMLLFCPRDWFFTKRILPTRFALRSARRRAGSPLNEFRDQLRILVDELLRANPSMTIRGVPFYRTQDMELLEWLQERLVPELATRFTIETRELSPEDYICLAKQSIAILGMRLHSLILGVLSGRPLVGMVYSSKVRSMVSYLGLAGRSTELSSPRFDYRQVVAHVEQATKSATTSESAALARFREENATASAKFFSVISDQLADAR